MKADQRTAPENSDAVYKTSLVSHETFGDRTYRYTYDDNNNITKIEERPTANGSYTTIATYTYDNAGQLVTEYNGYTGNTKTYTYDSGGNITKVVTTNGTESSTVTYGYDSVWKDKLVKYGDYEIETDDIGNPLTYRDGMSFTWQGRQMATANVGETAIEYKYNSDGLRTYKKVGETVYEYQYLGDKLIYQKCGDIRLYFSYDVKGHLASITRVKADGSTSTTYAVCNTRGDVDELRNASGSLYARYYYDAWGNVIKILDADGVDISGTNYLAALNPIRYRGYQYDSETGLYYLNSRYYDPVTHRFVNADDFSLITANNSAITDKNLFAYCDNNPVMREDTGGDYWAVAIAVGVGTQYVGDIVGNLLSGKTGTDIFVPTSSIGEYVAAGITALIPGAGVGSSIARNVVSEAIKCLEKTIVGEEISIMESVKNVAIGTATDSIVGKASEYIGNKINSIRPNNYSSYAGAQYKKNPNITREMINKKMKIRGNLATALKTTTHFTMNVIGSLV